jgi:hypothetical protein
MRQDLENLARRQPALMIGGALLLGLIGARFLKSSERRGTGRYGDGQRYGRERGLGYTGYNQPSVRGPEIGGSYTGSTGGSGSGMGGGSIGGVGGGYGGGTEGGMGGGYAGA